VDATAKNGVTALVGAIRCGHLDVARVLLEAGRGGLTRRHRGVGIDARLLKRA